MTLPNINLSIPLLADQHIDDNFNYLDGAASPFGVALNFGPSVYRGMRMISFQANLALGNNVIYLVPPGKNAIAIGTIYNSAGTTTTYFNVISFDGGSTWFRSNADSTIATRVTINFGSQNLYAKAGMTIGLNASQSGLNVVGTIYEFNAASPLRSVIDSGPFSAGVDKVLYRCPPDMVALLNNGAIGTAGPLAASILLSNESGSALAPLFHLVPAGGTPGTSNIIHNPVATVANNSTLSFVSGMTLSAGMFLNFRPSVSGKMLVWFPVTEMPA